MGFAEIGLSVNSDLKVPLNHLIWLNDYKTYGQDSYVYNDKNKLHALYEDYELSMNDIAIQQDVFTYVCANNKEIGKALTSIYGFDDISHIDTFDDLFADQSVVTMIANHEKSWINDIIFSNSIAMNVLANNREVLKTAFSVPALLNKIEASSAAINALANSTLIEESAFTGYSSVQYYPGVFNGKCFVLTFVQTAHSHGNGQATMKTFASTGGEKVIETNPISGKVVNINKFLTDVYVKFAYPLNTSYDGSKAIIKYISCE